MALGQRGPHSDQIVEHALTDVRDAALRGMLEELAKMTLTVIDGEFPREVIRDDDLTLLCWTPGSGKDSPGPRVETPVAEPAHEEKPGSVAGVANDPMRTVWDREAKLELRGQALVAVVGRGDGSDWKRLERVARDTKEQQLVRFWAVGAMGKMKPADTVTLLLSGAAGRGVEADAWSWDDAKLRKGRPELHRALAGYLKTDIGERAPHHLLGVLLGHGNDNVRRAAAAYFADTPAARAVLQQALAYDPERAAASGVPWKGGALFLPAGSYTPIEAADLVHALVHWQLWIEHDGPGAQAGSRVVQNNVFSLSRRYGVMAADWNANGATMAIAWSKRWAEQGRPFEAAELLVHAYEKGGKLKDAVRLLEELRAKRK
ncbi:MAG: hypothetical protein ACYTGX_18280 [Planctomycetota bacterium]